MSKDEVLSALKERENNFDKTRIKKIREKHKELRHKLFKSNINKIRKNLYEIGNQKSLFTPKEIEKYLLELEKNNFKPKKLL